MKESEVFFGGGVGLVIIIFKFICYGLAFNSEKSGLYLLMTSERHMFELSLSFFR